MPIDFAGNRIVNDVVVGNDVEYACVSSNDVPYVGQVFCTFKEGFFIISMLAFLVLMLVVVHRGNTLTR